MKELKNNIEAINLSASAKRMIKKYGKKLCIEAFKLYNGGYMGGSGVGYTLGVHTNTADALIFAGGELLKDPIFER